MVAFPRPGEQFGQYLIERVIGEGGMGVVYQATDTRLRRAVALKIVQPGLAQGEEFRSRFEREAATLARLRSRHIVQILEYGEVEGTVYLVTEFVPDGDLHHWLDRRGPLDPLPTLKLLLPVCEALDDAHRAGVVHRDVKPSNVLLWERTPGELIPYLCDFGIATDGDNTSTRTGTVIGSLAYMAPERHLGGAASPQGDVYSAGCVLWACLTGKPPYDGTDFQLMSAHLNNPVPQLPAAVPGASVVNPVLRRSLAKDPAQRYPSAAAFASALDAAIDELEEGPRTPRYASMPPPTIQPVSTGPTRVPPAHLIAQRPQSPSQPAPWPAPSAAPPSAAPSAPPSAPPPGPPMRPPAGPAGIAPSRRRRRRRRLLLIGGLVLVLLVGGAAGAWALMRGGGSGDALSGDDKAVADLIASRVGQPTWTDHATVVCATDKLLHTTPASTLADHQVVTKQPASASEAWTYNGRWPYADAKAYIQDVMSCSDDWAGAVASAWHLESTGCLHDLGASSLAGVVAARSLADDAPAEVSATTRRLDGCYATDPAAPTLAHASAYRAVRFDITAPQADNGTVSLQVRSDGAWKPISQPRYDVSTPMGGRKGCLQARAVVTYPWGTTRAAAARDCGTSDKPRIWLTKATCLASGCVAAWELHVAGFKTDDIVSVSNDFSGNVTCGSDCTKTVFTGSDGRGVGDKWYVAFSPSGTLTARVGPYSDTIGLG